MRRFDRRRPGKGSNQEWQNPHDPDAKIGRTKDGATDMIYKPETVVDLDTGAIVQAEVHPGDQADHKEMATRLMEAQQTINQASGEELNTLTLTSVTADKALTPSVSCRPCSRKASARSFATRSTIGA